MMNYDLVNLIFYRLGDENRGLRNTVTELRREQEK